MFRTNHLVHHQEHCLANCITQLVHLCRRCTNLTLRQPVKRFSAFCGTSRFLTAFTRARRLPLSSPNQSSPRPSPHRIYWRSILILSQFTLTSSKWSLSLSFPHQNTMWTSPLALACHMPFYHIFFDFMTRIIVDKEHRSLIPAVARSKAWVCGRSFAGIVGSNPAGCMDGCRLWVSCVVR